MKSASIIADASLYGSSESSHKYGGQSGVEAAMILKKNMSLISESLKIVSHNIMQSTFSIFVYRNDKN